MSVQLKTPGANLIYTFDWNDDLSNDPTGIVTLAGDVVHNVPTPFVLESEVTDLTAGLSTIQISGGSHGDIETISALAPLSTGEKIPGQVTIRCAST